MIVDSGKAIQLSPLLQSLGNLFPRLLSINFRRSFALRYVQSATITSPGKAIATRIDDILFAMLF